MMLWVFIIFFGPWLLQLADRILFIPPLRQFGAGTIATPLPCCTLHGGQTLAPGDGSDHMQINSRNSAWIMRHPVGQISDLFSFDNPGPVTVIPFRTLMAMTSARTTSPG
jgi:hypothetical protein